MVKAVNTRSQVAKRDLKEGSKTQPKKKEGIEKRKKEGLAKGMDPIEALVV